MSNRDKSFRYGLQTQPKGPPAPEIRLSARNPEHTDVKWVVPALIDTGAACTAIPRTMVEMLELRTYGHRTIRSPVSEEVHCRKTYYVDLWVGDDPFPVIEVTETSGSYAIIGRDILNRLALRLDAPLGTWAIEAGPADLVDP